MALSPSVTHLCLRRIIHLLTLLAVLGSWSCFAADDSSRLTSRFEPNDLFALQYVTDPQIRPDGGEVAYVRVSFDVMSDRAQRSVAIINSETGQQYSLGAPGVWQSSPRWSPDGQRLAYISQDLEGSYEIHVRRSDGRTSSVCKLSYLPSHLAWSPDGHSIAFVMFAPSQRPSIRTQLVRPEGASWADPPVAYTDVRYRSDGGGYLEPGYTRVFLVPASGGTPRQLSSGDFDESGPLSWKADGKSLIAVGSRKHAWQHEPLDADLLQISVPGGEVSTLIARKGPDFAPAMSPKGDQIAYLGFDDKGLGYHNVRAYVADGDGGNSRSLTDSVDRSIDAVRWASDGRSLYIQYTDDAETKLGRVFLDGRIVTVARGLSGRSLDRPYTGGEFSISRTNRVAFTSGDAQSPSELAVLSGSQIRRLTKLNEALLKSRQLGLTRPLTVKSSVDGRRIPAWIMTPPDFDPKRRYPLILEIHGGPFLSSYGPYFSSDMQLYAAAGYVVLFANPRGSTSYGEEFANLIHRNYPGDDCDDLMSAVDAAIGQGFVDPHLLYLTGGSGGGMLTAWIVGKTARFRAAAAQKAMVNWFSLSLTTDMYTTIPRYWFGKYPWEAPDLYWKHSPLSLVGNVQTPTMLVIGEFDYRTPMSESEQFYQALQLKGVPTLLLKIPGANHDNLAARPSHSAARVSAILDWFAQHRGQSRLDKSGDYPND